MIYLHFLQNIMILEFLTSLAFPPTSLKLCKKQENTICITFWLLNSLSQYNIHTLNWSVVELIVVSRTYLGVSLPRNVSLAVVNINEFNLYYKMLGRIPSLLLILVLYGIFLIVLLWVIGFPPASWEDVFVAFIPATHHHFACYMMMRMSYKQQTMSSV